MTTSLLLFFSPSEQLKDPHTTTVNKNSPIFSAINKLLENNNFIEILEEGTCEGKSIAFKKVNNGIDIVFSLTDTAVNTTSISLTNIRLASPNVTFKKGSPEIPDFKNKLHSSLLEIKDTLKEKSM